jgi:hypothetical protein
MAYKYSLLFVSSLLLQDSLWKVETIYANRVYTCPLLIFSVSIHPKFYFYNENKS